MIYFRANTLEGTGYFVPGACTEATPQSRLGTESQRAPQRKPCNSHSLVPRGGGCREIAYRCSALQFIVSFNVSYTGIPSEVRNEIAQGVESLYFIRPYKSGNSLHNLSFAKLGLTSALPFPSKTFP